VKAACVSACSPDQRGDKREPNAGRDLCVVMEEIDRCHNREDYDYSRQDELEDDVAA
jgi:hypothetical protein